MSDSITPPAEEQAPLPEETEEQYEGTAEELTGFKRAEGVAWFNRKKVMMAACITLSATVLLGLIFSSGTSKKNEEAAVSGQAARAPGDFLRSERDRSLRQQPEALEGAAAENGSFAAPDLEPESTLPEAVPVELTERAEGEQRQYQQAPPPAPQQQQTESYGGGGVPPPQFVANFSPLVPTVEGSLFGGAQAAQPAAASPAGANTAGMDAYNAYLQNTGMPPQADAYTAQNNQANKNTFYNAASGGMLSGSFLQRDILWIGTVIPAVLETAINTDLPGNVIARVTQNIYDSHTGKKLLIPQGTLLVAQYNSSVSYAQKRVQIVWNTLIRPDGYQLELEGMNGVDAKGMAGIKARYKENWFEYAKAAGLITMFSSANAKMAEQAAQYGGSDTASAVVQSNAQFVNQMSGTIVGRAMDIQPTLLVESGEVINIMLNKNVYLPPLASIPVTQKYVLK